MKLKVKESDWKEEKDSVAEEEATDIPFWILVLHDRIGRRRHGAAGSQRDEEDPCPHHRSESGNRMKSFAVTAEASN